MDKTVFPCRVDGMFRGLQRRLWRLSLMLKVKKVRAHPGSPAPSPGPISRASLPFPEAQESLSPWL